MQKTDKIVAVASLFIFLFIVAVFFPASSSADTAFQQTSMASSTMHCAVAGTDCVSATSTMNAVAFTQANTLLARVKGWKTGASAGEFLTVAIRSGGVSCWSGTVNNATLLAGGFFSATSYATFDLTLTAQNTGNANCTGSWSTKQFKYDMSINDANFYVPGDSVSPFLQLGTDALPPDPTVDTRTRIISTVPADGTLVATSTSFIFSVSGYISPDDFESGDTKINFSINNNGLVSSQGTGWWFLSNQISSASFNYTYVATSSGAFTISTSTSLLQVGLYYFNTKIYNDALFFDENLAGKKSTFTVATTTNFDNAQIQQIENLNQIEEIMTDTRECDSLDLGCYFTNALVKVFYPSPQSVDQFFSLTLENSLPFSYVYQLGELRTELFGATQTGTSTVAVTVRNPAGTGSTTITFLSADMINSIPYASTIKTILGWLLWIMLIEYVYYRLLRVHDNQTPS